MAQSQLALYNMAVGHCGADFTISATSEESVPAEVCELHYENVRQVILRAAFWDCAKRHVRMTKAAARDETTGYDHDTDDDWVTSDPEPGYAFSYTLPSSMLRARYLTTFDRFSLGWEEEGDHAILSCDVGGTATTDAPILCYTVDVTDVTVWDADLYQAVAYGLAGQIAMALTGRGTKLPISSPSPTTSSSRRGRTRRMRSATFSTPSRRRNAFRSGGIHTRLSLCLTSILTVTF